MTSCPPCSYCPTPLPPAVIGNFSGTLVSWMLPPHSTDKDEVNYQILKIPMSQILSMNQEAFPELQPTTTTATNNAIRFFYALATPQDTLTTFQFVSAPNPVLQVRTGGPQLPWDMAIDPTTGSLHGTANGTLDATMYAMFVMSYASGAPPPVNMSIHLMSNGQVLVRNAWGNSGFINPNDGTITPFAYYRGKYPPCAPFPSLSVNPAWLGINVFRDAIPDSTLTITRGMHTWRFTPNNDFQYMDSNEFIPYRNGIYITSVIFGVMAVVCIVLWPVYMCCTGGSGGAAGKCRVISSSIFNLQQQQQQDDGGGGGGGGGDNKQQPSSSEAKIREMRQRRKELNELIHPARVGRRLWFTVFCLLLMFFVTLTLIGEVQSDIDQTQFQLAVQNAATFSKEAHDSALAMLDALNLVAENIPANNASFDSIRAMIQEETIQIALFATISNPLNLRISNLISTLGQIDFSLYNAARIVTYVVIAPAPFFGLCMVILASCTFRWGEETILCNRPSVVCGPLQRSIYIFCAIVGWIITGISFWWLISFSDFCLQPSALWVPITNTSTWNSTVPLSYDPNDDNYVADGYNWGGYFETCRYDFVRQSPTVAQPIATSMDPFLPPLFTAANLNALLLSSPWSTTNLAMRTLLLDITTNLTIIANTTSCAAIGVELGNALHLACYTFMDDTFFVFLSFLVISTILMVLMFVSSWATPNIYRMRQAELFMKSKSNDRDIRIRHSESTQHRGVSTRHLVGEHAFVSNLTMTQTITEEEEQEALRRRRREEEDARDLAVAAAAASQGNSHSPPDQEPTVNGRDDAIIMV